MQGFTTATNIHSYYGVHGTVCFTKIPNVVVFGTLSLYFYVDTLPVFIKTDESIKTKQTNSKKKYPQQS